MIREVSLRGKFITFEGLDGSGKSTQLGKLARALRAHGLTVTVTREPGGTATGERIREVLLHSATSGLSSQTEMALMFASRAQHIHEVVQPALAAGHVVLCDRFTDSPRRTRVEAGSSVQRPCCSCTKFSVAACSLI